VEWEDYLWLRALEQPAHDKDDSKRCPERDDGNAK